MSAAMKRTPHVVTFPMPIRQSRAYPSFTTHPSFPRLPVIPAQAGIQCVARASDFPAFSCQRIPWIPAFAGMTNEELDPRLRGDDEQ